MNSKRTWQIAGAKVLVFEDSKAACKEAAAILGTTIRDAVAARGQAVLGLATGSTPIRVYEQLVKMHQREELSFARVVTYNLDEYYPMQPIDPNSYRWFMHRHLFGRIDLPANRAHVLDGTVPEGFVEESCHSFERWIDGDGGLDLQLLGIGRNGHIGFNEPSEVAADEAAASRTRLVELHPMTTEDAVKDFDGDVSRVPRRALTMGVATILEARSILILAFGQAKATAVEAALRGPRTAALPASLLRDAPGRVTWLLDDESAAWLTGE